MYICCGVNDSPAYACLSVCSRVSIRPLSLEHLTIVIFRVHSLKDMLVVILLC